MGKENAGGGGRERERGGGSFFPRADFLEWLR